MIHVVGTNGKGSVVHKLAQGLLAAERPEKWIKDPAFSRDARMIATHGSNGCFENKHGRPRVGVFTSPHIDTVRERIRVDEKMISFEQLRKYGLKIEEAGLVLGAQPSYFEALTLIALLHFKLLQPEYVILEAGMGGGLDATSVDLTLSSDQAGEIREKQQGRRLCVLTNVAMDHMEWLGSSLEDITESKAKIMNRNSDVIIGPSIEHKEIIYRVAKDQGATIISDGAVPLERQGYNEENTEIVETVLKHLGLQVTPDLRELLLQARPMCRFQSVFLNLDGPQTTALAPVENKTTAMRAKMKNNSADLQVIFDVAHNPAGLEVLRKDLDFLARQMKQNQKSSRLSIMFALSSNKQVDDCLHSLFAGLQTSYLKLEKVCFTQGDIESRSTPAHVLLQSFNESSKHMLQAEESTLEVHCETDPIDALQWILKNATTEHFQECQQDVSSCAQSRILLVCGSFMLMSKLRLHFNLIGSEEVDETPMNETKL